MFRAIVGHESLDAWGSINSALRFRGIFQEVIGEKGNILGAFPQGRKVDSDSFQTVERSWRNSRRSTAFSMSRWWRL